MNKTMMKRTFSGLTLKEAMQMVPTRQLLPWQIDAPPVPPSAYLTETLRRLSAFDVQRSEAAKILLIDALLLEVVPAYPRLKIWKAVPLETDAALGIADYLIAPNFAYLDKPLLCAVEAKRDDFDGGRAQCIGEMAACRVLNQQGGQEVSVFGVVSNGQGWQFYQLTTRGEVWETPLFNTAYMPELLAALHYVCASCEQNVPKL